MNPVRLLRSASSSSNAVYGLRVVGHSGRRKWSRASRDRIRGQGCRPLPWAEGHLRASQSTAQRRRASSSAGACGRSVATRHIGRSRGRKPARLASEEPKNAAVHWSSALDQSVPRAHSPDGLPKHHRTSANARSRCFTSRTAAGTRHREQYRLQRPSPRADDCLAVVPRSTRTKWNHGSAIPSRRAVQCWIRFAPFAASDS